MLQDGVHLCFRIARQAKGHAALALQHSSGRAAAVAIAKASNARCSIPFADNADRCPIQPGVISPL